MLRRPRRRKLGCQCRGAEFVNTAAKRFRCRRRRSSTRIALCPPLFSPSPCLRELFDARSQNPANGWFQPEKPSSSIRVDEALISILSHSMFRTGGTVNRIASSELLYPIRESQDHQCSTANAYPVHRASYRAQASYTRTHEYCENQSPLMGIDPTTLRSGRTRPTTKSVYPIQKNQYRLRAPSEKTLSNSLRSNFLLIV